MAVGDVRGEHPRHVPPRLFRHAPAGTTAAVGLSPATARNRILRRLHHVLDDAGRAPDDARRPSLRARDRLRGVERDLGLRQRPPRDARTSAGRGRSREPSSLDRGRSPRGDRRAVPVLRRRSRRCSYAAGLPDRHPGGQPERCGAARVPRRSRVHGHRLPPRRHRDARFLHDVLDLDARDAAPRRGRRVGSRRCQRRDQPRRGVAAAALGRIIGAHV